ncbi:MAG: RNA-binding S4 domain-containing protein [Epsilonproteobacteria bacterium]|nr:MAG: RNA-binding S4 domain-containing protein [Campylobacterota bacterium]
MNEFELSTEYIELFKLLKALHLVGTGGEAKISISEGLVQVNGVVEMRKRYKVRVGDKVEYNGEMINIKKG